MESDDQVSPNEGIEQWKAKRNEFFTFKLGLGQTLEQRRGQTVKNKLGLLGKARGEASKGPETAQVMAARHSGGGRRRGTAAA
jgi:hypothetical protein